MLVDDVVVVVVVILSFSVYEIYPLAAVMV